MMNVITFGLGMIPVAGPFLAIFFPVVWTLVVDPDSVYDLLRDLVPGVDLTDRIIRFILDSINEPKEYLRDGWERLTLPAQPSIGADSTDSDEQVVPLEDIRKSLTFIIAEATLANNRRDAAEDEPGDGPEDGEVEVVNPPTEFPDEKGEAVTSD